MKYEIVFTSEDNGEFLFFPFHVISINPTTFKNLGEVEIRSIFDISAKLKYFRYTSNANNWIDKNRPKNMKIEIKEYPNISKMLQKRHDELKGQIEWIKRLIESIKVNDRDTEIIALNLSNHNKELIESVDELREIYNAVNHLEKGKYTDDCFIPPVIEIEKYVIENFDKMFVGNNEIELND